jgi:hypothetical protein
MAWLGVAGCSLFYPSSGSIKPMDFSQMRPPASEVSRLLRNAHYYRLMGRPDLALKDLEEARQCAPHDLKLVDLLARNYEEMGRFDQAHQVYEEALRQHGPHPGLENNLCYSYFQAGKWAEAEVCFRKLLARNPNHIAARNNLGLALCRQGKTQEAYALWRERDGDAMAAARLEEAMAALGQKELAPFTPRPSVEVAAAPPAKPSSPAAGAPRKGADLPVQAATRAATTQGAVNGPVTHKAEPAPTASALTPPPPTVKAAPAAPVAKAAPAAPPRQAAEPVKPVTVAAAAAPAQTPPAPAPKASPASAPASAAVHRLTLAQLEGTVIDVRNGTRKRHFARDTRVLLFQEGFQTISIGNHIDFGAAETVIYYRPGSAQVAQMLRDKYFPQARLAPKKSLPHGKDVKVLLGHDLLARPQSLAWLDASGH